MLITFYLIRNWFALKRRKLELELAAPEAAAPAARPAVDTDRLEARVRVLEQIVTDRGAQTAQAIEALRELEPPAAAPAPARLER
nr:hypothetical protein [Sphingomicrobium astaxanthinifaciens]